MQRDLGLDVIRIFAILMIITYHFTALFDPFFLGGYYGCVGTTIFYCISGYVMRITNKDITSLKAFYKKRFLAMFPIFWIAFVVAYIIRSIQFNNFNYGQGYWRLIYSFLGIDNYLTFYQIPSFYIVGEWFTTIIILIYILYPLLNWLFKHHMVETTLVLGTLYYFFIKNNILGVPEDANIFTGAFMFWIGMLCQKYSKEIRKNYFYPLYFAAAAIFLIYTQLPLYSLVWRNLVGISLFIILLSLTRSVKGNGVFAKTTIYLSTISYAVYLTHHYAAYLLFDALSPYLTTYPRIIGFYLLYLVVVLIISALLYFVTELFLSIWPSNRKKKKRKTVEKKEATATNGAAHI